jgi:hypothetical protein
MIKMGRTTVNSYAAGELLLGNDGVSWLDDMLGDDGIFMTFVTPD